MLRQSNYLESTISNARVRRQTQGLSRTDRGFTGDRPAVARRSTTELGGGFAFAFAFAFYCEDAPDRDARVYLAQVAERLLAEVFAEVFAEMFTDGLTFEFPASHAGAAASVRGGWVEIETTMLSG